MYQNIPDELKRLKQWCCFKLLPDESRPGKTKKIPVNAYTGGNAQSNNPETWSDYETAIESVTKYDLNGIGIFFAPPYFGVDIDGADDAIDDYKSGDNNNIISEFIHTLQSYAEYSLSGKGLHIICKGALPKKGRRKKNVEMYENGRFFIMTGNIASEYISIRECTQAIKPLHEKYIGGGSEPTTGFSVSYNMPVTERDIIEAALKSKQGQLFNDLYVGQWEAYYTSQSEADLGFCNILAFWCGRNPDLMDSIFRSSGLMREKWERIGKKTIEKAISECHNVYTPGDNYSIFIGKTEKKEKKLYSFDDTGNAERFFDTFGGVVRYSYINKSWVYYDGRKWQYDNTGAVKRMIDEIVESMRGDFHFYMENAPANVDMDEYEKQFLKHLKQSRSNKNKTAMLKESEHRSPILPEQFDRHKNMLNTPNGTINLKTGELMLHDKEKYITKITNAEYTDKIDAPMWENFINDIFNGDKELIKFMQKSIGYSITGSTSEDCAFFCYGTGRNGKSTFLETIRELLGDYSTNIQPETIMVKNNQSSATSDIARLKGARFVTTAEPNEGVRLNEGLIKQLTGGDTVTASKKYENEFEFKPEFKIWMTTNHKPVVRGTDIGIWSRIRLIPFTVRIPDEKIDKNLRYKLRQEMPGIFKWAVEGCLLWQKEGLKMPKAVEDATKEYKSEMDVLESFFNECCEMGDYRESINNLYDAYKQWAKDGNEYEMGRKKFGIEISKRLNRHKSNGTYYYSGIRLLPDYIAYSIGFTK